MYVVVPLKPLHIFAKSSFILIWSGPKYIPETHKRSNGFICVMLTCYLWPISQCIDLDPISRSTPLFWNSSFLKIQDTLPFHQSMLWIKPPADSFSQTETNFQTQCKTVQTQSARVPNKVQTQLRLLIQTQE